MAKKGLDFGKGNRKLDFLFNKNINPANPKNVQRARGNADRIGIADTAANRADVTRRFNKAFSDPSSIVSGGSNVSGRNLREFFLLGVTGRGSKIQFINQGVRLEWHLLKISPALRGFVTALSEFSQSLNAAVYE